MAAALGCSSASLHQPVAEQEVLHSAYTSAGSRNVIDIHGDIQDLRCTRCDFKERVTDYASLAPCPACAHCGAVVRPESVLFEELLPQEKVALMQRELARGFDLVFSIGTSSLFPYITGPVVEAAARQRPTVEINPGADASIGRGGRAAGDRRGGRVRGVVGGACTVEARVSRR
ncbi:Sir2 family NAD-dependent protein deacetylase [Archangium sp.]|uniref:Sir2 family NAD-dependent protein deacetylase n=1 Tax=Archangium sp. TaxID=1872627 RepID=UPI002D6292E0|nr:Sir2 family NAD-dependent protein deacetylase [Archangium sp.]HYO59573.1 Sir2 family NAD-dependent protein deacetylase [Archangium sp.]